MNKSYLPYDKEGEDKLTKEGRVISIPMNPQSAVTIDWEHLIGETVACAVGRRSGGSMKGRKNKNGQPDAMLLSSEIEFFCGAFEVLSRVRAILEGVEEDDRGRFFPPALVFGAMRGESVLDAMIKTYLCLDTEKGVN